MRDVSREQDPVTFAKRHALASYLDDGAAVEHHDPLVVRLVVVDGRREPAAQDALHDAGTTRAGQHLAALADLGGLGCRREASADEVRHAR